MSQCLEAARLGFVFVISVVKHLERHCFLKFMMTSSNENSSRITGPLSYLCGEFTDHRWIPLCLNKRLSKQLWGWRFETQSRPLWRHCNVSGFSVTYGGSKVTGTIYFCNWGTPVNEWIPHIFIGAPIWLSVGAPYTYLEAPRRPIIHFRNWGIPISVKYPI